jgi:mannose-6-phosphate isomerase-like protein (cupin superfamily)
VKIKFDVPHPQQFNVFMVTQLAPDTFVEGVAGLDFVVVPAKSVSEVHRHNHSDNVIYVLNGSARALLDGETYDISRGMRVVIPKGVGHGFITGDEPLEFISVQVPPILNEADGVFDREIIG